MTDIIEPDANALVNIIPTIPTIPSVSKRDRKKKIIDPVSTQIAENTELTANNESEPVEVSDKVYLTNSYTRNAIERYRAKNIDKAREYNKLYNQKRKEDKIKENPFYGLTKQELIKIINDYKNKVNDLEEQVKALKKK
jgi:hypothetical protein